MRTKTTRSTRSDSGETLVEVLIAIVVFGLIGVALIYGLMTALMGSSDYRTLANVDAVLKTVAADVTTLADTTQETVGGQQVLTAFQCPTWAPPTSTGPGGAYSNVPATFGLTISVQSWNALSSQVDASCTTDAPLVIAITASAPNGGAAADSITIVVSDPQSPAGSSYSTGTNIQWLYAPGSYPNTVPGYGDVQAGTPFNVAIQVEDANGSRVLNDLSPVTLNVQLLVNGNPTGSPTQLSCSAVESGGVITFSGCVLYTAGTYEISTATTANLSDPSAATFTVVAGSPAQLSFTQSPSNSTGGVPFATQPTLQVEDSWGNVVTADQSKPVLGLAAASGTIPSTAKVSGCSQTEVSGVVTFTGCSVNTAFTGYELTATDLEGTTTITSSTPSSPFTISVGPAYQVAFTQAPTGGTPGAVFSSSTQPWVAVQDEGGNTETSDNSSVVQLSLTQYLTSGNSQQPLPSGAALACTGTNSSTGITSVTVTAGVAKFSGCSINDTGDGYSLTASDSSVPVLPPFNPNISPYFDIAGTATKLVFTTEPSTTATAGVAFPQQPVVSVEDANGNVVTTGSYSVTLSSSSGTGTFNCTTPVATTSGVANFSGCDISLAGGPYTLTATATSLTSATSTGITVGPGQPTQLVFEQPPASPKPTFTAGGVFSPQPVVEIEDVAGNVVTTDDNPITLSVSGQNLTCSGGSTTVDAVNGVATFQGCGGLTTAGNYTLVASDTEGTLVLTQGLPFTVTGGPPTAITFSTPPGGNITGGVAFPAQPAVTLTDMYGNPATVTGSVQLAILPVGQTGSSTTGSGALTCSPSSNQQTVTNGVATYAGCEINTIGTYTLQASYASLSTDATITVVAGPATSMTFTASPNTNPPASSGSIPNLPAGTAFATQPTVTLYDAGGNVATGDSSSVTLSGPSGDGFTCSNTTVAVSKGVAPFGGCEMTKAGGPYTLTAADTADGLPSITSAQFDIVAASPTSSTITVTGSPSSVTAGATFGVTVTVRDAYGNAISGATVSLADSTGTMSGCTAGSQTTNASGVETFTGCSVTRSGSDTLTASVTTANGSATGTGTLTVAAAAAHTVAFSSPWSSATPPAQTAHTVFTSSVTVTVTDKYGNAVASGTTVTLSDASGTLGGCAAAGTTNSSGQVTWSNCYVNKAGSDTLTATSGSSTATTASFTVNTGAAYYVTVSPSANPVTAGSSFSVSVTVTDQGNNPLSGQSVTLSESPTWTTACATPNPAQTNTSGVETFTGCVADRSGSYTITGKAPNGVTGTDSLAVSPGVAHTITYSSPWNAATPPTQTAHVTLTSSVVVTVTDQYGNDVASGTTVTLSDGSGTLGGCTAAGTTNTSGQVTWSTCYINKAGSDYLTATSGSATGTTNSFTVSVGAPYAIALNSAWTGTVNAQYAGTAFGSVVATVTDAGGNDVSGSTVTLTDGFVSLDGCTAIGSNTASGATNASGQATFTGCYVTSASEEQGGGTDALTASDGAASTTSSSFTVDPGSAAILVFRTYPATATVNTAFATQPSLEAEDAYGNEVTAFTGTTDKVTISIATGTGVLNTCSATPTNGVATVSGCKFTSATAGTFVLQASGGGVSGLSGSFPVGENTGTYLYFVGPTTPFATASQNAETLAFQPTVEFVNYAGTVQTGDTGTVTLSISSGSGTLTGCTATVSKGVATFSSCEITLGTAGPFTITATATKPTGVVAGYSESFYVFK